MGYTVIGSTKSRALRVLWLMEELGLDYDHLQVMSHSEEVKRHSPLGKIPILLDGEEAIPDSVAIMTYLADKHGGLTYPAGTVARGRQDSLTHQILDEWDALLWTAARHSFILPEEHRVEGLKDSLKWEFSKSERNMAARLGEGPFLMGEMMTIPDILLTHCIGWAITAKFPVTDGGLRGYAARLRARPAFERVMAE